VTENGRARLDPTALEHALDEIASGAERRDLCPSFPDDAFDALREAGALSFTVGADGRRRVPYGCEWGLVRAVAGADGSVGRILDGHLNGVERLGLLAPEPLRRTELTAVERRLLLGVWGADPAPGEGDAAVLRRRGGAFVLEGTKVFCSGAGGVDRALVMARTEDDGPPMLAYLDPNQKTEVDRGWFRGPGLRASESHLVTFQKTPVIAVLGGPGELARQPWFGRDAIRTAASWAGMADTVVDRALHHLSYRACDDLAAWAAGRILAAQGTVDAWLERAAGMTDGSGCGPPPATSVLLRTEVQAACMRLLDEAARACGSRPFAGGDAMDRARRDLELFLLQHRLDPMVAAEGRTALQERRS
jgi:alkylation response protein AidB-like acyl-CoA dehydrogenase